MDTYTRAYLLEYYIFYIALIVVITIIIWEGKIDTIGSSCRRIHAQTIKDREGRADQPTVLHKHTMLYSCLYTARERSSDNCMGT